MKKTITGADLFSGAGGFTQGFRQACQKLGLEYNFVAVNHWDVAIATHSLNHPDMRHILDDLQHVKPSGLFRRATIEILLAAPECTHHSRAAGGVPRNPQSRATAGYVIRWARALRPKVIIVENVREFREWGPLSKAGKPLKRKKGELFNKWLRMLTRLGYSVDHRVLCAADYGDPTTRERLFVIARADGQPVVWPAPTHSRAGGVTMFGQQPKWKSAKEHVIDWNDMGASIFNRKKSLSPNTMRRIWAGIHKFGSKPFLAMLHGTSNVRSVEEPAPTVTASGAHLGLAQPFICNIDHNNSAVNDNSKVYDVEKPLPTVMTMPGLALVEPFIVSAGLSKGAGHTEKSVDDPLGTVVPDCHDALVQPFLLRVNGGKDKYARMSSVDDPVGTVTGHPAIALVEPFVLPQQSAGRPRSTKEPLPTVSAAGAISLVEPYMVALKHTTEEGGDNRRVYDTTKPMPTITARPDLALVRPFLVRVTQVNERENTDEQNRDSVEVDSKRGAENRRTRPDLETEENHVDGQVGAHPSQARGVENKKRIPHSISVGKQSSAHDFSPSSGMDSPARTNTGEHGDKSPGRNQAEQRSAKSGDGQPLAEPQARLSDRAEGSSDPTIAPRNATAGQALEGDRSELQPDSQEIGNQPDLGIQGQPFLISYHGSSYPGGERVRSIDEPVPTVATANQYALVIPSLDGYALDIRFRMLKVSELARAQGFADSYVFSGTTEEKKRQIGNAVPVNLAEALCVSQLQK